MSRLTCFGCGRHIDDRPEEEIAHADDCPERNGAEYRCSCRGQYHGQDCDGKWVGRDGETVSLSAGWAETLKGDGRADLL
jgi:hypothetical protein